MLQLSLLIPTIKSREVLRQRLLDVLYPQINDVHEYVELLIDEDDGEVSIGAKRNRLVSRARGQFVAFIDDDDLVDQNYVRRIALSLEYGADVDCVGFKMRRFSNGRDIGEGINSLAVGRYFTDKHPADPNRTIYYRTPNHLNPVRREIAKRHPFPNQNFAEDSAYAAAILPELKRELFINEYLYFYYYRTPLNRAGERTNA
jgi:hypothetical protein